MFPDLRIRSPDRHLLYRRYKTNWPLVIIASTIFPVLLLLVPPVRSLFQMTALSLREFLLCAGVAFAANGFEVYKMDLWKTTDIARYHQRW